MAKVGRFRFSLKRVLNVREIQLSVAQSAVAEANLRLRAAEAVAEGIEERIGMQQSALGVARSERELRLSHLLLLEAGLDHERKLLRLAEGEIARRLREQEEARLAYARALREVRALERLRDLRREEHAQERRREESKAMDEIASARSQAQEAIDPSSPSAARR